MRYITTIIIILIGIIPGHAQPVNGKLQPFQVLYAENTKNQSGVPVKSLDLITIDDTLHIQNGTLSLIHHTGFPLEISTDTIIEIKKLHKLIMSSELEKKEKIEDLVIKSKPYLDFLFITNKEQAQKNNLSRFGACHDCGPTVSYPPTRTVYYKNELCIKWRYKFMSVYSVTIRSMYDEIIMELPVTTTELSLDADELSRLKNKTKETTFLITFQIGGQNGFQEHILIKEYKRPGLKMPYTCTLGKATFALMAALYNEQPRLENISDAEKYYVLATQLSDRKFYKDMLDNFRKRNEK